MHAAYSRVPHVTHNANGQNNRPNNRHGQMGASTTAPPTPRFCVSAQSIGLESNPTNFISPQFVYIHVPPSPELVGWLISRENKNLIESSKALERVISLPAGFDTRSAMMHHLGCVVPDYWPASTTPPESHIFLSAVE